MVDGFDVDGGDVVGEQHDLVGVNFVLVFVRQLLGRDQAALQESRDERASADEGVQNVDAFRTERDAELFLKNVVDAVKDEVHHFDGRVDDPQAFGHSRKGVAEELVVEFHDDLLLAFGFVDPGRSTTH